MTILSFDRVSGLAISDEAVVALQKVANRHGLSVAADGGRVGQTHLILKFRFEVTDTEHVETKQRQDFDAACRLFGFQPAQYKMRFQFCEAEYELVGFILTRRKYPIKCRRVSDGKLKLFTRDAVSSLS